jgi:hypothetical protein
MFLSAGFPGPCVIPGADDGDVSDDARSRRFFGFFAISGTFGNVMCYHFARVASHRGIYNCVLLRAVLGCQPDQKAPDAGKSATKAKVAKHCCKGQNECKGQGGCGGKELKGKNECKGKGGCSTKSKCAGQGKCAEKKDTDKK